MSMPLLLAAGMMLGPLPAGVLAFVGTWDVRLLRGEITWTRDLFNRSQVALSSFLAAVTFHALGGTVSDWPSVVWACLAAAIVDTVTNLSLVSVAATLRSGQSLAKVLRAVVLDYPLLFAITYAGLAPLALLMATAADLYGVVGLCAGLVPILMAHQVFSLLTRTSAANRRAKEQEQLVEEFSHRIEVERRDERARIAMDLHDGALAELYRVHLMGEVLRQDLQYGRLLELEADVPELRNATTAATDSLRALIRGLRDPSVGAQGVCKTLDLLVEELATTSRALFHTDISPVNPSPSIQLAVYQVAREALENAARHSDAQNISVSLRSDGTWIRLLVRDDGRGFERSHVDQNAHFGLAIMAQRVHRAGGDLHVASEPGWGTQVVARLPVSEAQNPSFRER
jgi:signal transduction histidine kinase